MDDTDKAKSLQDALKSLFDEFKVGSSDITMGFANMLGGAEELIKTFGVGRQRMVELMGAVADATPAVDRLGGNLSDAVKTIEEVSKATRRNVVAGTEEVSKLYASSKILGQDVDTIVNGFQEIGVEFTKVGSKVEESIGYIQSVGGNVKQIMGNVLSDMSALNKFNFQEGVVGMTKMAAQAAMLKVDMRTTLEFAERALDPDSAIELASAFQRLGVSASDLTDPFQLMNKSLNDPEGLQNSIVNMSKQFAFFDEKANQFKINPQGMLMMREIGKQTGLSSAELSKMALGAAELDKKLSQIRPEIQFAKEEDKTYLANIAKMGDGGKYQVSIDDKQIELEKLSQGQINKLIEEQKKGPKTVEDLQRAQLDALIVAKGDVRSIKDKVVLGIISPQTIRRSEEEVRGVLLAGTSSVEENVSQKTFREGAEKSMDAVRSLMTNMRQGGSIDMSKLQGLVEDMAKVEGKVTEGTQNIIDTFLRKLAEENTSISNMVSKVITKEYESSSLKSKKVETPKQSTKRINASDEIMGEIKTTTSSINTKIDSMGAKLNERTSPSGNQINTEIIKEIQNIVVKQEGQVKVSFDSSNPIKIDINLTSDGKLDMAKMEDNLLNSQKISEALSMNILERFKSMNLSPIMTNA